MRKSQSLIIQFVLFFLIGFSLFLTIGNFFRAQSDSFRSGIVEKTLELTDSYLSSIAINSVDTCKQCDFVTTSVKVENTTAGYFLQADASTPTGIAVSTAPDYGIFLSSLHNLNESLTLSGEAYSTEAITLTFNRTKNELEVK
jgi:hypothetical protein